MSHGYALLCSSCKELLSVGKVVNLDVEGRPLPWQFEGRPNDPDYPNREGILIALERFLILHRTHPVHLVPEDVFLEAIDNDVKGWREVELVRDLFARQIIPEPDVDADSAHLPTALRQSLTTD